VATDSVGTFRSAWSHKRWRWLFGSIAVSSAGDWLYVVALVVFLIDVTGSAGWVAVASITRMAAYVFLSPIGGALADRYDRRKLMISLDLARAGVMVLLAVVVWTDAPVVVAIVLATMSSAFTTPYRPCGTAATTELVGEQDLAAANAAESIVAQVATFLGPALGAAVVALTDPGWAFLLNALTFLAAACFVLPLGNIGGGRRPKVVVAAAQEGDAPGTPEPEREPGMVAEIRDGARVLRADRALLLLILIGMAATFLYGFETVVHVLVAEDRLGMSATGVGVLAAAVGLGGLLIAPLTPRLGAGRSIAVALVVAAVLQGVPMIALSVISSPVVASAALVVEGAAVIVQEVLYMTLLQRAIVGEMLGRIYGLQDSLSAAAQGLGSVMVPVLLGVMSLEWALVVGGGIVVLAAAAAYPGVRTLAGRTEAERVRLAPIVADLRGTGILGDATQVALERIARSSEVVPVAAATAVFHEGDAPDRLYVVRSGSFAVERAGVGEVARLGPESWFGEVGLIHRQPRNATVSCVEAGEVVSVPGEVFLAALEHAEVMPDPLRRAVLLRSTAGDGTDGSW
jgi:predicted MFS family arabinose efflux permease